MTIALLTGIDSVEPGTCLFCGGIMDTTGCRVGSRWASEDLRASGGIERVVDVYCAALSPAPPTAQQVGSALQKLRESMGCPVKTFRAPGLSQHRLLQIKVGGRGDQERASKI